MNWDAAGAIGEIVGAIAVVASLMYLAVQIRAQVREVRLTATRELSRDYRSLIAELSRDDAMYSLYRQAIKDYDGMPDEERTRIHLYFYTRLFGIHEQFHLHRSEGDIDPVFMASIERRFAEFSRLPGAAMWWRRNREIYSETFRRDIDKIFLESAEQESKSGNVPIDPAT